MSQAKMEHAQAFVLEIKTMLGEELASTLEWQIMFNEPEAKMKQIEFKGLTSNQKQTILDSFSRHISGRQTSRILGVQIGADCLAFVPWSFEAYCELM